MRCIAGASPGKARNNERTERALEALKEKVTERRAEFAALMAFIESETSYLTAPASTRFHLCKEQGLLEHSVNVAENLLKIKNTLAPDISDESCVIAGLLHDLGKAG
ncbi:MAG: HD domain-containing protein, partial [Schwartzia sp.]|nr:HD domain-containing protein [Schwartzia sp. (in: firmicutes)]